MPEVTKAFEDGPACKTVILITVVVEVKFLVIVAVKVVVAFPAP